MEGVSKHAYYGAKTAGLVARTIDALKQTSLPLSMPGSVELEESRRALLTQLESRILPHLDKRTIPTVVVIGGSSGAGKSTLVNSLVGEEITEASVLRPTTRTPVLVLNPANELSMKDHALDPMSHTVVVDSAIEGLAIVDAPDLDSVDDTNRELSARLLDAADLWVFVTTAARYGDAMAWSTLELAQHRGITCAIVLNRVSQRALDPVRRDLMKRMAALGLGDIPLFIVPDQGAHSGLLDPSVVAQLRGWLSTIAATGVGESLVDRTTKATLPAIREDLLRLADGLEMQEHALLDLADKAREAADAPLEKILTNVTKGRLVQGAPTASWLAAASTGGPLAGLVARRKPSIFDRKTVNRDGAMTGIFDAVLNNMRVAIHQGVVAANLDADKAWQEDIVDTESLRAQVASVIDTDAIVERAMAQWFAGIKDIAGTYDANVWLGENGVRALIAIAGAGLHGATTVAKNLGLADAVKKAEELLLACAQGAIGEVSQTYVAVVSGVDVGDSANLRLRASEFLAQA